MCTDCSRLNHQQGAIILSYISSRNFLPYHWLLISLSFRLLFHYPNKKKRFGVSFLFFSILDLVFHFSLEFNGGLINETYVCSTYFKDRMSRCVACGSVFVKNINIHDDIILHWILSAHFNLQFLKMCHAILRMLLRIYTCQIFHIVCFKEKWLTYIKLQTNHKWGIEFSFTPHFRRVAYIC